MNLDFNRLCLKCMRETIENGQCTSCRTIAGFVQEPVFALPLNTILHGRYLVGAVLGHGGFGITYMAYDLKHNQRVAVKEYMPDGLTTRVPGTTEMTIHTNKEDYDYGLGRFLDEARIIHRYRDNPNIISVMALFEENRTAYYVMEYLDGCDLKRHIAQKGGKLPYAEAIQLLLPVFDALGQIHGQNIVHRDISPDNIYVCKAGSVKLLDFGAARVALGGKSQSLSIILKRGYAPEEQYRSHGKQGPFTDVYALAGTLYYAITGTIPPEATQRMYQDELTPPSALCQGLPQAVDRAIVTALSVKSEDRFQTMGDFKAALTGKPISYKPSPLPQPPLKPAAPSCDSSNPPSKANLGRRFAALVIDGILLGILFYGILFQVMAFDTLEDYYLALYVISFLYSAFFEGSSLRATPGKRLLGLVVTDVYGHKLPLGRAIYRNAVKYCFNLISLFISLETGAFLAIINFGIGLFNRNNQAGHDLIAHTMVSAFRTVTPADDSRQQYQPVDAYKPLVQKPLSSATFGIEGVSGHYRDVFFPLADKKVIIGRSPDSCHIIYPNETRGVSRVHCEVALDRANGAVILRDLGSSNGTFVSGGKRINIDQGIPLYEGDQFTIGENNTFRVKVS